MWNTFSFFVLWEQGYRLTDIMLPYLQFGILITGCTGLCAYLCGPGLIHAIIWLSGPRPGQMWGSGLLLVVLLFGGTLLGAVAGFRSGMRYFGGRGIQPWGFGGWMGVVLGLGLGVLVWQTSHLHWIALFFPVLLFRFFQLAVIAILAAAAGVAGDWMFMQLKRKQAIAKKKKKRARKKRNREANTSDTEV